MTFSNYIFQKVSSEPVQYNERHKSYECRVIVARRHYSRAIVPDASSFEKYRLPDHSENAGYQILYKVPDKLKFKNEERLDNVYKTMSLIYS